MYTGNQKELIEATGEFEILTKAKYLTTPDYLKRGDILMCPGHTAVVVSTETATEVAKDYSKKFVGTYKVSASKLNIRTGAGTAKSIITTIPQDTVVTCYGYYTKHLGTAWLLIQFNYNNKQYTGFASSKYLIK